MRLEAAAGHGQDPYPPRARPPRRPARGGAGDPDGVVSDHERSGFILTRGPRPTPRAASPGSMAEYFCRVRLKPDPSRPRFERCRPSVGLLRPAGARCRRRDGSTWPVRGPANMSSGPLHLGRHHEQRSSVRRRRACRRSSRGRARSSAAPRRPRARGRSACWGRRAYQTAPSASRQMPSGTPSPRSAQTRRLDRPPSAAMSKAVSLLARRTRRRSASSCRASRPCRWGTRGRRPPGEPSRRA